MIVRGRFVPISAFVGDSVNVETIRWIPCSPATAASKSEWLRLFVAESLSNSPKDGRTSMAVVPRSDLISNLATVTLSLSVADANVIPIKRVDAIPFFNTGISGGVMTFDGDIIPLDDPPPL